MGSYQKTILRMFKNNLSRFISMTLIIMVGIAFVTGVGGISPKVTNSFDEYLRKNAVSDFVIKSKSPTGFTEDEINTIINNENVSSYSLICSYDTMDDKRLITYKENNINKLSLVEGSFPANDNEIVIEEPRDMMDKYQIGDSVLINGNSYTISGIVNSPLLLSRLSEKSIITNNDLKIICYLESSLPITTDIYLNLDKEPHMSYFSAKYDDYINSVKGYFDNDSYVALTLNENKGYAVLTNVTDKINIITLIFPVFFILVVSLVVLTTLSRLIDEDRNAVGCLLSLGYGKEKILFKYLFFTIISTMIGCILGLFVGAYFLPNLIYPAFNGVFILPKMTSKISLNIGIISSVLMLLAVVFVSYHVSNKIANLNPPELFLPPSPKKGKKILLERVRFIWNRLSFKYKSSYRNIFRYTGRLLMVVISVSGSTALIMAGLGLFDVSDKPIVIEGITIEMESMLRVIAIAIVAFSLALSVLVIYNLTNMNIGERKREIATLMVLGYKEKEVYGYIYREILIMAIMGIIIGIPLGAGLLGFIFNYLAFGSIANLHWYTYIISGIVSLLFVFIVDLLLAPHIKNIDMNDSLKSLE